MDPWRKKKKNLKNSCKLAAESWAVKQKSCVGLGICVILSPGSLRKARGQMPATFYPRKGKKRTQKKRVGCCGFFFFPPLLKCMMWKWGSAEPGKGSPSNWAKPLRQMLAYFGNGRYFGSGILKMQSFSCSGNNQRSEMALSKWLFFFPNMTNPRRLHRDADVLLVRALGCKGQFLNNIKRLIIIIN